MGILSTLGSLAFQKATQSVSKSIATKAIASGYSVKDMVARDRANAKAAEIANAKQEAINKELYAQYTPTLEKIPDNLPLTIGGDIVSAREGVKSGVGGFGEGQTIDSISKGYSVPAYRTQEKQNPLYSKAISEVKSIESFRSGYDIERAKELNSSWTDWFTGAGDRIFSNTSNVDGKSISELKIARNKAIKEVMDFKNPNSEIHKTFKKNIESQGINYDKEFREDVEAVGRYVESIKLDKSNSYESSGIRGYLDLPIIRSAVDLGTDGEYSRFSAAIRQAKLEGVEGVENEFAYNTSNLLGGALLYGAMGGMVSRGLTMGLSEAGFGLGGRVGGQMVKIGNKINTIERSSPTLYAIAVDNPLTTAIDYGVTKSLGGKYAPDDVSQALYTGTAISLGLKGLGMGLKGIYKGVTPRQLTSINDEIERLSKEGGMTKEEALMKVASETEIEPGKTIIDAMDEAGVVPRDGVTPAEVRTSLVKGGVSTSNIASKKVAKAINNMNEKIKSTSSKEEDVLGGYGEMDVKGKAQMAKQGIISDVSEAKLVNGESVDDIIKNNLEKNGFTFSKEKGAVSHEAGDILDDAIHNPKFSGKKLREAESMDDVGYALTGDKFPEITIKSIDEGRASVALSTKNAEVEVRDIARKAGIEINEDKLITKIDDGNGGVTTKLNQKYADDLLYRAKVRVSGYKVAKSTALANVKNSIEKNIVSMRKGITGLSRTLKIEKKEYGRMVKEASDSLHTNGSYSILSPQQRKIIISSGMEKVDGTIKSIEEASAKVDAKLHIAAFNKIEDDTNKLLKKIRSISKSKSKKNTVDLSMEEEIISNYKDFAKAKSEGDLVGMRKVYENMKTLEKEGRNIYKESKEVQKIELAKSGKSVLDELDLQGKTEFNTRFENTQATGDTSAVKKGWKKGVKEFAESMIQAHLQFLRIFGKESIVTKVLYKDLSNAESKTRIVENKLFKNWVGVYQSIRDGIGLDNDNIVKQVTLWRNSRSRFMVRDKMMSGHDYNMVNDMVGYYDKNGNPQLITTAQGDTFRKENIKKIKSGEYIDFFGNASDPLHRQEFLNKLYKKFDNLYETNKAFRDGENFFRSHFEAQGAKNASLMKRIYNKLLGKVENYNPILMVGKSSPTPSTGEMGQDMMGEFFDTIDSTHLLDRIGPGDGVRMELDFSILISHHINGSVHWGNMIEPLNRAEALLRLMKKGRGFIESQKGDIDEIINNEMGFGDKGGANAMKTMVGEGNLFKINSQFIGQRIMTPEVEQFLQEHIKKVATRGGSISSAGVQGPQNLIFGLFMGRAYKSLLTWVSTSLKQTFAGIQMGILGGGRNTFTGMTSIGRHSNWSFLLDESGHLIDRQAELFTGAKGRKLGLQSNKATSTKVMEALDKPSELLLDNMVKGVDGGMSAISLLAGISKALDEKFPHLHTKGRDLNLREIKEKLTTYKMVDGVRIADDSAWREVLGDGELFMHQVMGSNSYIDDALGAKGQFGKVTMFMGKAATNYVVASWDAIIHNAMKRQLAGKPLGYDKLNKIKTFSYWVLGGCVMAAANEYFKDMNDAVDVFTGRKEQSEIKRKNKFRELADKKDAESFLAFTTAFIEAQFYQPATTFDILKGYETVTNAYKDLTVQETTEGKLRAVGALGVSLVPGHQRIADLVKLGIENLTGYDMRHGGLKDLQKSGAAVRKKYGDEKFDKLTQSQKDELVAKQLEVQGYNKGKAKVVDPKEDFKEKLSQMDKPLTEVEFMKEIAKYPDALKSVKSDSELRSMYASHVAQMAKTSGERDSVLMGSPIQTVYDLEILPLMKSGKAGDAFERVKELRRKGIIKSDKGAIQIIASMKEYQNNNP